MTHAGKRCSLFCYADIAAGRIHNLHKTDRYTGMTERDMDVGICLDLAQRKVLEESKTNSDSRTAGRAGDTANGAGKNGREFF